MVGPGGRRPGFALGAGGVLFCSCPYPHHTWRPSGARAGDRSYRPCRPCAALADRGGRTRRFGNPLAAIFRVPCLARRDAGRRETVRCPFRCAAACPDRVPGPGAGAAHLYGRGQDRFGAAAYEGASGNAVAQTALLAGRIRRLEPPDALSVTADGRTHLAPACTLARLRLRLDAPHYGL